MKIEEALKRYKTFLASEKMLVTQERLRILQGVFAREDHFSADDLLFHMRQDGLEVSRATLYRNLKLLAKAGFVVEADFGHGHLHYERVTSAAPHEHLVCQKCGSIEEVESPVMQEAMAQLCAKHGFELDHYQLRVHGTCKHCHKKRKKL